MVRKVSTAVTIPAPIGGWNARDSLGDMDPRDAVFLKNWYASTSDVILRNGHTRFATGFPDQVETVMAYAGGATNRIFGISDGDIYDATAGGAVLAASVTGLTNSRFQYVNFATTSGAYLVCCNGLDPVQYYTGSAWAEDGDGAPYDITGVTSSTLINVNMHKNRLWYIQKNTLKAWYLATLALGGAALQFDLSSVAQFGGHLIGMYTWTIDAGFGVDDLAVFITDKGEVIVYRGTDPASAGTWQLVGIWRIGAPVGYRCAIKFAGDLLVICQDGVYPLSGALQSSRTNPKVALTDKITFAVSTAISSYGSNYGWQLLSYPKENMLFLNVPVQTGANQEQYVMNTITKSWSQFIGWSANCWEIYQDDPYFGGNTYIGKAWNGADDAGVNINGDALQAFSYLGRQNMLKRVTMIRPFLLTDGAPSVTANVNVDYDQTDTTGQLSFTPTNYSVWDTATWDAGVWGSGLTAQNQWQGASGIGYAIAPRVKAASKVVEVHWVSTSLVFEPGAIL